MSEIYDDFEQVSDCRIVVIESSIPMAAAVLYEVKFGEEEFPISSTVIFPEDRLYLTPLSIVIL